MRTKGKPVFCSVDVTPRYQILINGNSALLDYLRVGKDEEGIYLAHLSL